jgi:hypothetical protein
MRNTLIQIVADRTAPSDIVALAADLIAADVRFDDWFLRIAKRTFDAEAIERLLKLSDDVVNEVDRTWRTRSDGEWNEVRRTLESGLTRLKTTMNLSTE